MSEGIRIVVCLKQVPDPEAPASSFKINSETRTITVDGVPPVINPYDERALELALALKDGMPDVHITAVSAGPKLARPVLMRALAVGADELVLIEGLDADADAAVTTNVLAAAIKKIDFDIVLTSRQAADSNAGVVGLMLAETLKIPAVSWVRKIEIASDGLVVERIIGDQFETLKGKTPALLTISHEAPLMRMPKLPDLRKAKQKPIHQMKIEDMEMDVLPEKSISCVKLEAPLRERDCHIFEADSGVELVRTLFEKGILS